MLHKKEDSLSSHKLIEEIFPIKEIGIESVKEKSNRHGHISTLHTWWARRPLASSRATAYASLIPNLEKDDNHEWLIKRQFIVELSKWENSFNYNIINKAKKEILDANNGKRPKVLDPFAGGGSIPLEALRLGCEVYSYDYNPVAVLIQKCTIEYPSKYSNSKEGEVSENSFLASDKRGGASLLEHVRKWGEWVLEEATRELQRFYPEENDTSIPIGYIWARTIPCQNTSCGAEIPLMRQYILSQKGSNIICLYPVISGKKIKFKIAGTGYGRIPKDFAPENGTISRAIATCIVCGSVVDDKTTRKLFFEGKSDQRLLAVLTQEHGESGKGYRVGTEDDISVFNQAEQYLQKKRQILLDRWSIDPIPDEPLPPKESHRAVGSQLPLYNFRTFGDLFNSRQKMALIVFTEKVRLAYETMLKEGYNQEVATVVSTYLALALDRLADYGSVLCVLNVTGGRGVVHTFGRHSLQMTWDYMESNPLNPVAAGWVKACEKNEKWIEHASQIGSSSINIGQSSATSLPFPDDYFDAVLTDPPYYDNVPYSYISDFFYVWLKRTIGHLYPDLFSTPLTPKSLEIVAYQNRQVDSDGGKHYFETMLKKSFQEINRVLKQNGISVIVYAHKSTAGWETLVNSLLNSGLVVTAAWPINTEKKGRLVAQETASLASSIYMVVRKLKKEPTGFYREVKEELRRHLDIELDKLWDEGIAGADFFISAIGTSIEIYGKYEKIIDDEGNVIEANRFLEIVRTIVTDYAVHKILHNGFAAEISAKTRFYLLWRWAYGEANVPFDDARKMAQSIGIDLIDEWNRKGSFIKKEKEFIKVLGPEERRIDSDGVRSSGAEMIDVLHIILLLWKKGKKEELLKVLKDSGFGKNDVFYRVAQAISESLPDASKEKKLLDGFMAGKGRLADEVRKDSAQKRLFDE